jgi:hypothetical protein
MQKRGCRKTGIGPVEDRVAAPVKEALTPPVFCGKVHKFRSLDGSLRDSHAVREKENAT